MKILGIEFGSKKIGAVRTESQAMNTPFLKVGKGNLSLPFIQSAVHSQGMIYFGEQNLFPQLLNQMYYTSPLHSSIVDFSVNPITGGGVGITPTEDTAEARIDVKVFSNKTKYTKLNATLTRDYYGHRRVHVLLKFSQSGKFLTMKRVDPSQIRYRFDGDFEYAEDWSTQQGRRKIWKFNPAKPCGEMLYTYQDRTPGQDYYPIPSYSTALNW